MPEKRWKRHERKVAQKLGGRRVPVGVAGHADVESEWIVAEVKSRQRLPQWLKEAVARVKAQASETQLPLVALVEVSSPDVLVVMRLQDFTDWFGDIRSRLKALEEGGS